MWTENSTYARYYFIHPFLRFVIHSVVNTVDTSGDKLQGDGRRSNKVGDTCNSQRAWRDLARSRDWGKVPSRRAV